MLQSDRQEAADQMETEWYFVMLPPPIEHTYVCVCVGSCICRLAYLHMYVYVCERMSDCLINENNYPKQRRARVSQYIFERKAF